VFGLDPNEFPAQRLVIVHGARATGDEALLGDHAAKRLHLGPGSTLRLGRHAFRVAGIYHTGDAFQDDGIVLPLPVVQRLAGRPGDVSTIAVNADLGTPPKALARELERRFVGTTAVTEPGQAVRIDTSSRVIIDSGWIISLLALIVGGIAVANTMAMSVFERVREIGILRAVGWRSGRVAALIASEALGICALGLGAGLLLGYAAAEEFAAYSESGSLLRPTFTPGVFAWGLAFAVGVALVGALYPSWRAVRLTPIEALRRE
jgi:putative ABC transport system permease protein